jgi:hypothetical protein
MNPEAFGAEFSAMTEDEQMLVVGGDRAFMYALGLGLGIVEHWVETAIIIGGAMTSAGANVPPFAYIATMM